MNKTKKTNWYVEQTISKTQEKVLASMKKYGSDWVKTWSTNLPRNHANKPYTGTNSLYLSFLEFKHKAYITRKNAEKLGIAITDDYKNSIPIVFNSYRPEKLTNEEKKNKIKPRSFRIRRVYSVYNISQTNCEIVKNELFKELIAVADFKHSKNAETLCNNIVKLLTHMDVKHEVRDNSNDAFFRPIDDLIVLPQLNQFKNYKEFIATLFHELTHWSMVKSRLDREKYYRETMKLEGKPAYAVEELVAELSSATLCGLFGIEKTPSPEHAKYLNNWMKSIEEDADYLMKACSLSNKAVQYILKLMNGFHAIPEQVQVYVKTLKYWEEKSKVA